MLGGTRWAFDVFSAISPPILPVMPLRFVVDCWQSMQAEVARRARACGVTGGAVDGAFWS